MSYLGVGRWRALRFQTRWILILATSIAVGASGTWHLASIQPKSALLDEYGQDADALRGFDKIYFLSDRRGWAVMSSNNLFVSNDGASTWTGSALRAQGHLELSSVFFVTHDRGWVVGGLDGAAVIFRTIDSGVNWVEMLHIPRRPSWSGLGDVWFLNDRLGWAVGTINNENGVEGLILSTEDGGSTWRSKTIDGDISGTLRRVRFADTAHGWVVGDGAILRTDDGGRNWREQFTNSRLFMDGLALIDQAEAWATGSWGLLLHTADGGDHWNKIAIPAQVEDAWLGGIAFADKRHGWVVGQNGLILSSQDTGVTWRIEAAPSRSYLHDIALTSGGAIAVGKDGTILFRER
jgi:photosystem II stability/assembly factor-like uncharacterized protein